MAARISFLFAIKAATDLDALPTGVRVFTPENGNGLTLRLPGLEYPESDVLLRFLGVRNVGGSTWRVFLALPLSLNWRQGAKVMRFLRRLSMARPAAVRGPWSLKQFAELFPTVADAVLYPHAFDANGTDLGKVAGSQLRPPEVMAGDTPEALPNADYRPSDAEAAADTEPDPTTIFPAT